jgi:NDP-sugar pyrophosphorylase family protein
MKAMILAAGLGTRLGPLTQDRPKALVEINGRTQLELILTRLRGFGIHELIINVHHFADMVIDYLKTHDNFGMRIAISREDVLLDTGGGLKKAAPFFLDDPGSPDEPFVLHNVDVLTNIDLARMVESYKQDRALAVLAVQDRKTSRYLLFDNSGNLCGRRAGSDGEPELVRPGQTFDAFAFSGIHIISKRILKMLSEPGAFSIITSYLRLAAQGEKIHAFRADKYYWRDLGKPENIKQASEDLKNKTVN